MNLTLKQIAALVAGKVKGNDAHVITGASGLESAGPAEISFLRDASKIDLLGPSSAGAVFVGPGMSETINSGKNLIEVQNPMAAFAMVLGAIAKDKRPVRTGVHPQAFVSPKAKLGKNVWVGPFAVIEDEAEIGDDAAIEPQVYIGPRVKIGNGTKIFPNAVIREEVVIGQRCIIHGGAVIGSDGFGFYFEGGKHNKIPQVGNVVIEDDVEIGSCTTIDRATVGSTRIGRGTKVDNLVQIAHNVQVGPHCILVAQAGIAGSSVLEEGVVLGGQVGVADHVKIGKGAQVAAQSGLKDEVPPGSILFGSPAQPMGESFRQLALIKRLPELFKEFRKLKGTKS